MCKIQLSFLLVFLSICLEVQDAVGYRSSRSHGSHSPQRHKKHFTHRLPMAKMMMPSGNFNFITVPTVSKKWNCDQKSKLIELSPNGKMGKKEYDIVKKEMEMTWGGSWATGKHQIIKIEKIINTCLWNRYKYRKNAVIKEAGVAHEQMLFHGSSAIPQLIEKGFDERYAKLSGYFGAGVYFASNPTKSNGYTPARPDGSKQLLLCRISLGNMKVIQTGTNTAHAPVGFHSIKGDIAVPEFVIYRGEQAYPEYLITYK